MPPRMECNAPMLYRMHDISNFTSVIVTGRRVNGSSLNINIKKPELDSDCQMDYYHIVYRYMYIMVSNIWILNVKNLPVYNAV